MSDDYRLVTNDRCGEWGLDKVTLFQIQTFINNLRNNYPEIKIDIHQNDEDHLVRLDLSELEKAIPLPIYFPYFITFKMTLADWKSPVKVLK
jgi:hypothetical protein|nr:MAG TPA: hypothetical protein [Myoviridae sp. ctfuG5]